MMDPHDQTGIAVDPTDMTAKYSGAITIGAILALIAIRVLMDRK